MIHNKPPHNRLCHTVRLQRRAAGGAEDRIERSVKEREREGRRE
jgi:hypothetical protein